VISAQLSVDEEISSLSNVHDERDLRRRQSRQGDAVAVVDAAVVCLSRDKGCFLRFSVIAMNEIAYAISLAAATSPSLLPASPIETARQRGRSVGAGRWQEDVTQGGFITLLGAAPLCCGAVHS